MSDIKLGDKVITGVNEIQVPKANAPAGEMESFHHDIITSVTNTIVNGTLTTEVEGSDGVRKSGSVKLPTGGGGVHKHLIRFNLRVDNLKVDVYLCFTYFTTVQAPFIDIASLGTDMAKTSGTEIIWGVDEDVIDTTVSQKYVYGLIGNGDLIKTNPNIVIGNGTDLSAFFIREVAITEFSDTVSF